MMIHSFIENFLVFIDNDNGGDVNEYGFISHNSRKMIINMNLKNCQSAHNLIVQYINISLIKRVACVELRSISKFSSILKSLL